jgi:hypothetical protein
MIVVLGYNNSKSKFLDEFLINSGIEFKYSLLEPDITKSNKIILPHPENFNNSYKRMNMMNLFSVLKMIDKPILGINDGLKLMCNQIPSKLKCGLGLFPIELELENDVEENKHFEIGNLLIEKDSLLVNSEFNNLIVNFDPQNHGKFCEYTSCSALFKDTKYSITYESGNFFGVELDLDENRSLSNSLFKNFLHI